MRSGKNGFGKKLGVGNMKKLLIVFLDMWKADYQSKTFFFSAFSALIGIGFTLFNAALGILYNSVWNGTICVYYVLLAIVRGIIVYSQRRSKTADSYKDNKTNRKVYIIAHTTMLFTVVTESGSVYVFEEQCYKKTSLVHIE